MNTGSTRLLVCLIPALVISLASCDGSKNKAESTAPDVFKGLKLNTHKKEYPDLKFLKARHADKYYVRPGERLEVGGTKVRSIVYVFSQVSLLYQIRIEYDGRQNYDALKAHYTKLYGKPSFDSSTSCNWNFKRKDALMLEMHYSNTPTGRYVVLSVEDESSM